MVGESTKEQKDKVTCQTVTELGLQSGAPDSNNPFTRALHFLMQTKHEFSKQRQNLIMRRELNTQIVCSGKRTASPSLLSLQFSLVRAWTAKFGSTGLTYVISIPAGTFEAPVISL